MGEVFTKQQNLDWSKLKDADDKIIVYRKLKFDLKGVENIAYQHLLLFPQCFQKLSSSGWLEVVIVW